jgi:hypothetical protein
MRSSLKTIAGMFLDVADAQRCVFDLEENGFPAADISVVMRERYDAGFGGESLLKTAVMGNQAATVPMERGYVTRPGSSPEHEEVELGEPLIAAGPLAIALGGKPLGIAAGGIAGALSDIGIPNNIAWEMVERVRDDREVLVTIRLHIDDADRVEELFVRNRVDEVYRSADRAAAYADGGTAVQNAMLGY